MTRAILRPYGVRAAPSVLPERMDAETDFAAFRDTVASLAGVNRMTMGYRPLTRFLQGALAGRATRAPLRVLDVGSGYGDGVRAAAAFLEARGVPAEIVGVDRNPHAAAAARGVTRRYEGVTVAYVTEDVFAHTEHAAPYDLVLSALFTHHLEDDEVVRFLTWMDGTARGGWLVNDLYRSRLAAAGFGLLARLTRRHAHVRHDGPVSFARSFRRADWDRLLGEAGVTDARIGVLAPFRLCVWKHG